MSEFLGGISIIIAVPLVFVFVGRVLPSESARHGASDQTRASLQLALLPVGLSPIAQRFYAPGTQQYVAVTTPHLLPRVDALRGPDLIHIVRSFGRADTVSRIPGCDITGQTAFDRIVGQPRTAAVDGASVVWTRWGARFKEWGDEEDVRLGENHRDALLANFAEFGVPISMPLRCSNGGDATLADALRDQVANFGLHERELAWTSISLALYMPTQKAWTNRDGEFITRDDLCRELLRRDLNLESCRGIHILQAMNILLRVDAEYPVLDPNTREALFDYLRQHVALVVASQASDGRWSKPWRKIADDQLSEPSELQESDLLVTGHILEWLIYLPSKLQPPRELYDKATAWTAGAMRKESVLRPSICPWVHAMRSLAILCQFDHELMHSSERQ